MSGIWQHRKVWRMKTPDGSFKHFTSIDEAREKMGFTENNKAFRWDLANDVQWKLEDIFSLSYTVTFDTDELQSEFVDHKHDHDVDMCYLAEGVEFDKSRCRFDW